MIFTDKQKKNLGRSDSLVRWRPFPRFFACKDTTIFLNQQEKMKEYFKTFCSYDWTDDIEVPQKDQESSILKEYEATQTCFLIEKPTPMASLWRKLWPKTKKSRKVEEVLEALESRRSLLEVYSLIDSEVSRLLTCPYKYVPYPIREIEIEKTHLILSVSYEMGTVRVLHKGKLLGLIQWHLEWTNGVLKLALAAPTRLLQTATQLSPYGYFYHNYNS